MMLSLREEAVVTNSKLSTPSTTIWIYLTAEVWVGLAILVFLTLLAIIKSLLPKPPRDLTGDIVLVAGVSSTLGESIAEEFAKNGCRVICVDNDLRSVDEVASRLRARYPRVEEIRPRHRKNDTPEPESWITALQCDLSDCKEIRNTRRKIREEIGRIDVLVTCVGVPDQDIFDTANTTLMSHYWTVLGFLPLLFFRDRAHIVGVTPIASSHDAFLGSRAAIASLMESLGEELSNFNNRLVFLATSPVLGNNSRSHSERQVAMDVVQAVKSDQCSLTNSWTSRVLYRISCAIYSTISTFTQWINTQGCDQNL